MSSYLLCAVIKAVFSEQDKYQTHGGVGRKVKVSLKSLGYIMTRLTFGVPGQRFVVGPLLIVALWR